MRARAASGLRALLRLQNENCGSLFSTQASSSHTGFVELREYTLHPSGMVPFIKLAADTAPLRSQLLPFLGMFTCDTGGPLNRVLHFYHYENMEARDAARRAAATTPAWAAEYIPTSRQWVAAQESSIYVPGAPVLTAAGSVPVQDAPKQWPAPEKGAPPALYELRQYQLNPGYGSVPALYEAFAAGVPDKVAADTENGKLVFFGHTDVGVLNSVIELWRYDSAGACMRARQAARGVPKWRETIAAVTPGVQMFRSCFLNPVGFSPLQ